MPDKGFYEIKSPEDLTRFNTNTHFLHAGLEATYSHWNHKDIYIDFCRYDWYSLRKVLKRFGGELRESFLTAIGKRFQGQDLQDWEGKERGPCIVVGSGPSLDDHIERFRKWEGAIICSPSQYGTLRYYNIDPAYIVCLDPKHDESSLDVDRHNYKETALIANVCSNTNLLRKWKGKRLYFHVHGDDEFHNRLLPTAYDWVNTMTLPFGCTPASQIIFAKMLGYNPIFLFGCDLSYSALARFTSYNWQTKKWVITTTEKRIQHAKESGRTQEIVEVNGVTTDILNWIYQKYIVATAWLQDVQIINCSGGLLQNIIPSHGTNRVFSKQGLGMEVCYETLKQRRDRLGVWLAGNGVYWIEADGRYRLITFYKDLEEEWHGKIDDNTIDKIKKDRGRYPAGAKWSINARDILPVVKRGITNNALRGGRTTLHGSRWHGNGHTQG